MKTATLVALLIGATAAQDFKSCTSDADCTGAEECCGSATVTIGDAGDALDSTSEDVCVEPITAEMYFKMDSYCNGAASLKGLAAMASTAIAAYYMA